MGTAGRKILVIDDNPGILDLIRRMLGDKDFQVSAAQDGKTGIEKAILDVDQETEKLKSEVTRNAGAKKLLIQSRENQKKKEAERRTENFEKWLKDT